MRERGYTLDIYTDLAGHVEGVGGSASGMNYNGRHYEMMHANIGDLQIDTNCAQQD